MLRALLCKEMTSQCCACEVLAPLYVGSIMPGTAGHKSSCPGMIIDSECNVNLMMT